MTTQNLVANHLSNEQWGVVDGTIDALEEAIVPALVAMGMARRMRMVKMGDGSEAFVRKAADVFTQNLGLLPRDQPGSVLELPEVVAVRAVSMARDGKVTAVDGSRVTVRADTICLHGDTPGAAELAKAVRKGLEAAGIRVACLSA